MAEPDELERSLVLARQALRGPAAMKERVRSQLAAGGAPAPTAEEATTALRAPGRPATRDPEQAAGWRALASRPHPATVAVFMGLSFGAGFWFGRNPRSTPSSAEPAMFAAALSPSDGAARAAVATSTPTSAPRAASTVLAGGATKSDNSSERDDAPANAARPAPKRAKAAATVQPGSSKSSLTQFRAHTSEELDADALAHEVALLERTERAIRAGEGTFALALLAELDRLVPMPALREERAAARVLAHCVQTRKGELGSAEQREARARAERFLAEHRRSMYGDRIRTSCSLDAERKNATPRVEERRSAGH